MRIARNANCLCLIELEPAMPILHGGRHPMTGGRMNGRQAWLKDGAASVHPVRARIQSHIHFQPLTGASKRAPGPDWYYAR